MSACYSCGKAVYTILFSSRDVTTNDVFSVAECAHCGLMATIPFISDEKLRHYYGAYYGERKSIFDVLVNGIRVRQVRRFIKRGSLLDIGCGSGSFLALMRGKGWDVAGTEVSHLDLRAIAEQSGAKIYRNEEIESLPEASLDVVTLWHVFEHLHKPQWYLKEVRRLLRPGGLLVIEVPNYASLPARFGKGEWLQLEVPRHTMHLTERDIRRFLEHAGFFVEQVRYGSFFYDMLDLVQTALNKVTRRKNLFFDVLGKRASWRDYKYDAAITVTLLPFVSLGALCIFPAMILTKRAGLVVFARKQ